MAVLLLAFAMDVSAEGRKIESFNYGWRFVLGNVAGAEQPQFDDSQWRTVNVPHDFQIEQPWVRTPTEKGFGTTGKPSRINILCVSRAL